MPKRSNAFQQAILLVKQELAGTSATVQESVMLPNAVTGENREVDILIEKKVAGTTLKIGVECIDQKRKADSTWVEKMFAKHADLPTNALILASRNGFTTPAERTANARGLAIVDIRTPTDTLANTVVGKLREVFLKRIASKIESVWITVFNEQTGENEKFKALPDTEVVQIDESKSGQMLDIVNEIRATEQVSNKIFQDALPEHTYFRIEFLGPVVDGISGVPLCVRSLDPPKLREILNITLIGRLKTIIHSVTLDSAVVENRTIAWGEVKIEEKTGTVLLDESDGKIKFISTFSRKELDIHEPIPNEN